MSEKLLVTPAEAAKMLSISRTAVYGMVASGELPPVFLPCASGARERGALRLAVADLQAWVDSRRGVCKL